MVIYHLSDLHFRTADDFDRQVVLRALWRDIGQQMKAGLVPDCIAVTGDIAWSGKPEEYKRAESDFFLPLLERTNLNRDDIFLVPGNHDVDRDVLSDVNPEKIASLCDRETVNKFIGQPRTLSRYLASFEAYRQFEAALCGTTYDPTTAELSYCRQLPRRKNVVMVGLNTAWTSGYSGIPNRGSTEQGHLIVGERQVIDSVKQTEGAELVLMLMHHPLYWLADFDKATVEPLFTSHADFVLHGHVHRPSEVSSIVGIVGGYVNLGAGAAYDRRVGAEPYVNSYSIADIDLSKRSVTITVRKYVDAPTSRWTSHEDLVGEGSKGVKHLFIPSSSGARVHLQSVAEKRRITSTSEIFRTFKGHANFFSRADSRLKRNGSPLSNLLIRIFEDLIVDWINSQEIKFVDFS